MTKPEMLAIMRLLAALEASILSNKVALSDHLWDQIAESVETLEREILK